ncbi:hypothetical protein HK105_201946 [Polyrhizophydium stewartii]|uniref:Uncharacterized protein n=1 Tax=Polyrhizophydium stewartii TaxID=2732419 RepID=A0ABR4NG88_9FUNG
MSLATLPPQPQPQQTTAARQRPPMQPRTDPLASSAANALLPLDASRRMPNLRGDPRSRASNPRLSISDSRRQAGIDGEETDREPRCSGLLKVDSEIYSLKFSSDEAYLALASGDARISVFSMQSNTRELVLDPTLSDRVPCTSLCFRPDAAAFKNKSILAAAYADGSIRHWHYTSGQLLSSFTEDDNQTNILVYCPDGGTFATAGSDMTLRLYDGVTQKRVAKICAGRGEKSSGHSNRIFCTKFHPTDPNLMVSGGWDNTIQIWDLRLGCAVRSFFGPHICGDSLDFDDTGSVLLTGSYSKDDPLQIWSWESGQVTTTVPWSQSGEAEPPMAMLYSAQFSKGTDAVGGPNRFILGGCSGAVKEARVFSNETKKLVGSVTQLSYAVYATAMSASDRFVALGGSGKTLIVCDVEEQSAEAR